MKDIKKADEIFRKINNELSSKYKGKIIAIEPNTGNYFIGDSEIDAYRKAIKKYPKKQFLFRRIGFKHTHFIGAF